MPRVTTKGTYIKAGEIRPGDQNRKGFEVLAVEELRDVGGSKIRVTYKRASGAITDRVYPATQLVLVARNEEAG